MKCTKCGAKMIELFMSMACSAECDLKPVAKQKRILLHLDAIDYLESGGTIRQVLRPERAFRFDPNQQPRPDVLYLDNKEWKTMFFGPVTCFEKLRGKSWPRETQWEVIEEE